MFQNHLI